MKNLDFVNLKTNFHCFLINVLGFLVGIRDFEKIEVGDFNNLQTKMENLVIGPEQPVSPETQK